MIVIGRRRVPERMDFAVGECYFAAMVELAVPAVVASLTSRQTNTIGTISE